MQKQQSNSQKPRAIVVGLDCMTGLQTARILHRHGVPVIGIASNPEHFCCHTNVCDEIYIADTASDVFIQKLVALGPQLSERAVLVPCTDMSVLLISRSRERLDTWYRYALPEPEVLEMLMNKISFFSFAKEYGLVIPVTFLLHNREEAAEAAKQLNFPCIVKPPMKSPKWQEYTKAKVFKVANAEEFISLYDRCSEWADILMAQEWIEGPDSELYSCNCYFDANSEPLVTFIARKLRQWPPRTGTSCLGEEVRNDEVLQESLKLFRSVNYQGLGYVEIKRDIRTGKQYIIEPNIGRPTGRSAISEAGGVELVYTMYCDVVGLPLPENRVQNYEGVKWIYWRRDLQSAFYYWREGELNLREWWQSWRGRKGYAVFSWKDSAPFRYDLYKSVGLALGRERK